MISLSDKTNAEGHAIQRALRIAIDSGEIWADESYQAVVRFRAELASALLIADVKADA